MMEMKPLVIGDLTVDKPIIQGGMGVGISLHRLAGAVAKAGGMGIISSAQIGFQEPDFTTNFVEANVRAIHREMKLAREIAPEGVIGFNIMVATKHYDVWVKEAIKAGTDCIISGAGLPVSLPEYASQAYKEMEEAGIPVSTRRVKLAPIVSSAKSASVICRMWDRKYHMAPDFVVAEGPLAGGHLGFSLEQLKEYGADTDNVPATYRQDAYDQEVREIIQVVKKYEEKYEKHIPVVTAGEFTPMRMYFISLLWAQKAFRWQRVLSLPGNAMHHRLTRMPIYRPKRGYCDYPESGGNAGKSDLKSFFAARQGRRPAED